MDAPNHQRRVLLVDDNPDLIKALTMVLAALGSFDIITAEDGLVGLERAYIEQPDCIVIDVKMPQLDGYQLVKALRGDPDTAQIPLIILTALVQDKDQFTSLAVGADVYLTKPVKPQDLVAAIHFAIAQGDQDRAERLRELAEQDRNEL